MNKRCCGASVRFLVRGWGAAFIAVPAVLASMSLLGCQPQKDARTTPPSAEATHSPTVPTTTPGDHSPPPRMPVN